MRHVAAGALDVVRFDEPNIWDVAGGVALALAENCAVYEKKPEGWTKMERFEADPEMSSGSFDLGNWRRPLVIGQAELVAQMCAALS